MNDFDFLAADDVPCTDGKEVFMLATNARLDSKIFSGVYGVNLTSCTESCRDEPHCKSLTFVKNTTDTYCQLAGAALDSGVVTHERMLSPVNGVYYLEKICLKGRSSFEKNVINEAKSNGEICRGLPTWPRAP